MFELVIRQFLSDRELEGGFEDRPLSQQLMYLSFEAKNMSTEKRNKRTDAFRTKYKKRLLSAR